MTKEELAMLVIMCGVANNVDVDLPGNVILKLIAEKQGEHPIEILKHVFVKDGHAPDVVDSYIRTFQRGLAAGDFSSPFGFA